MLKVIAKVQIKLWRCITYFFYMLNVQMMFCNVSNKFRITGVLIKRFLNVFTIYKIPKVAG